MTTWRRSVALVLTGSLLSTTGCYSGEWAYQTVHDPGTARDADYGSTLRVKTSDGTDPQLTAQVMEEPSCRQVTTGDEVKVGHAELTESKLPLLAGGALMLAGVGMLLLGSKGSSGGDSLAAPALALMGGGVAIDVAWLVMPGKKQASSRQKVGTYSEWSGTPHSCGTAKPVEAEVPLHVDLVGGGNTLTGWDVTTDASGRYTDTKSILPAASRLSGWCPPTKIVLTDGVAPSTAPEPAAGAQAPARRHGEATELAVPFAAPKSLEQMRKSDPALFGFAMQCCSSSTRAGAIDACTDRCMLAGGAGKCSRGMHACETMARGGEFATDGLALCTTLRDSCLAAHGSSATQLETCKSMCADDKAKEVCK